MAYCTQSEIEKLLPPEKLIELTDDNRDGVPDTGILPQAIKDADSEIDGYCGVQYTVPFTTVPDLVKRCSIDITIYRLYSRRLTHSLPDAVRQRYDDAIALLKNVAAAKAKLPIEEPSASESELPLVVKSDSDRIFTSDTLKDY